MAESSAPPLLSRRELLRVTAAAGAAMTGLHGCAAAQGQGPTRPIDTPEEALRRLVEGNANYVTGDLKSFEEDLELIRKHNEGSQAPFASVLACADSRVPVEILFDQTLGRLFVTRVAGNIATPEIIASLEYGVVVLGTKLIMVLGHSSCGAVGAAIEGKPVPGQISTLYAPLRPAVIEAGPSPEATTRANARIQARLLREASPALADLVKQKKLLVVAAYYNLATGKVDLI